jgi:hypothetical protein
VKNDKSQQADTPQTPQTEKAATAKDRELSKYPKRAKSEGDQTSNWSKKTVTAHKTMKSAATKTKEKEPQTKTQIHIEFLSTSGRMGSGGFGR